MLVVAHRTCPLDAPENSLAGIRTAAALGADVVEVDVRLTADKVPVLFHDPWLVRMTHVPRRLRSVPAERIAELQLRGSDERIPTFAASLRVLLDLPGLRMAVDVKDRTAFRETVETIDEVGARDRVLLWSQHEVCVRHFARECPDVEVALLRDTHTELTTRHMFDEAVEFGAQAVSIHWSQVEPAILDDAHGRGLVVYAWCKRLDAFAAKAALPLDGLVTDWPREMREMFAK
jgi:glycerophosphoryl diester phosphodiesterase